MSLLEIALDKVVYVIWRSRQLDETEGTLDDVPDDDDAAQLFQEPSEIAAGRQDLESFLASLNDNERASLIAIAWIGRGSFAPEELMEAIATAKSEFGANATRYLLQMPLLPEYLSDGLEDLGFSTEPGPGSMARRVH